MTNSKQITFTEEEIGLIKRTACNGNLKPDEFQRFMHQVYRTGLNPLTGQIHAVTRWNSSVNDYVMSVQVAIDGFRLIAEKSGKYAGQLGPYWCGEDGQWKDAWLDPNTQPAAAKVGVKRHDFTDPLWQSARFDAYAQQIKGGAYNSFWRNKGDIMIAKCAEALALRRAFPQDLSGIYIEEEISSKMHEEQAAEQSEPDVVQGQAPTNPATGENLPPSLLAVPPRKDGKGSNWGAWGLNLATAMKNASSAEEIEEWCSHNGPALGNCEQSAKRVYDRLMEVKAEEIARHGPAEEATPEAIPEAYEGEPDASVLEG